MDTVNNRCLIAVYCFLAAFSLGLSGCGKPTSSAHSKQIGFQSYDDAADTFVNALRENDDRELLKILGPDAKELIWSGDKVNDSQGRQEFVSKYDEQHRIDSEGDKKILVVGKQEWPFPIPIIEENGRWVFDTASGKEEILDRRIGFNELDTIQTMLAIVDAQREYAMETYDNGVREYAQKFKSDPGMKNGLYWETPPGQKPSPLGPFMAQARQQGYSANKNSDEPSPYNGYFYRMLTAQGEHAEEGAYDYIVNGKMIGGFAVVAYPAEYGNSGVMTFIVNHDGVVYQKDLGNDTEQEVKAMQLFDPDHTWKKVK